MAITGDYLYNGVDRVDNNAGYTMQNCVPCCKQCNKAKGTLTVADFKQWIARAYAHQRKTE